MSQTTSDTVVLPSLVSSSPLESINADVLPAQLRQLIEAEGEVDPSLEEIQQILEVYVEARELLLCPLSTTLSSSASTSRQMSNVTSTNLPPWRSKFESGRGRRKPSSSSLQRPRYDSGDICDVAFC